MSNIAALHPQVVHFVIALLIVGVLFRLVSLTGKLAWTNQAATALLILGTIASAVAVKSGIDAHGPVERVPGSRPVVVKHEEAGETTRNIFFGVVLLELGALALSGGRQRALRFGSAAVGLVGLFFLYETGEEGGELVYSYAGGVGLRTGDPEDVGRLLLAGQYHQAMLDRKNGKGEEAAALISDMARRLPGDTTVMIMQIESTLRDRKDAVGALAALDGLMIPADNRRLVFSTGILRADAQAALGQKDAARATLTELLKATPDNPRLKAKLDSLQ
ncbi:MAG: hypothetical protein IT359_06460 [Gemmatimonadaceae bacterium]|nr:hypothetical protein [Gemmatimonadaceae bacterium]